MNNGGVLVLVGGVLVIGLIIWMLVSSSAGAAPIASATLTQYNGSGISGTASFVPTSDGNSTSVTVQLSGLQQDAVYSATVNNGACLGPRLFILTAVTGTSTGQGSSTTTLPAQPQSYWFIAVHATASPNAPLVACGQVSVTGATGSYASPNSTAQPGQLIPVQNQQPLQLPNGGGGPPKQPIPTPVDGH